MNPRNRSTKLLAITVAFATLAVVWAVWFARPAKAIIIINSKTGLLTLTQGTGYRVLAVNTGGEVAIIDDGDVVDSAGNTLIKIPTQRLLPGQGVYLADFVPRLAELERQLVRVEVTVEDPGRKGAPNFLLTVEAYDTSTGKTFIIDDGKSIIDDGK